jgi:parallel beta-helix repeat protein
LYSANSQYPTDVRGRIQARTVETGLIASRSRSAGAKIRIGIGVWACLFALALPAAAQSSNAAPPTFVPGALTGSVYAQTLAAVGTAPIAWSVTSGALPPGLSLGASTGIIGGTPTAPGIFTFKITAANAGGSNSEQLSLTVTTPPTPPSIGTASPLPAALTGSVYTQTLSATGTAPITWSVTSGALPAGLSLGSSTGVVSGTPTAPGVFTFTASAANAGGSNSKQLSLTVNTPPSIVTTSPLPAALTGSVYTQTLSATGTAPITWSVTSGALPAGLSLGSSTGILSGTPTAPGVFTFTASAANAGGSNSKQLSLTVNTPPSIVTTSPLPGALTGLVYTQTLSATGTAPITWSVTSGTLPAGLSLGPSTGIVSGTPTAPGTFTFTASATNAGGSNSEQLSLTVNTPVTVSLTPSSVSLLPSQNQTFTATVGGTSNTGVTWSFTPASASLVSGGTTALYLAPSTAPTTTSGTITATSIADPSKIATALITRLQAITVFLSPSTVTLSPSGTQQFAATVLGTSNTAVTWSINPSVGTISSAGRYTAPSSILTSQTVTVMAQSVGDPTKSFSATISLSPPTVSFTYYVDSANGLDSNPGTMAKPWKTIAKVNLTKLTPGQSVGFASGGVWRETLVPSQGGTAGSPITFGAYGTGQMPIISGANLVPAAGWMQTPSATIFSDSFDSGNSNGWAVHWSNVSFVNGLVSITGPYSLGNSYRIDRSIAGGNVGQAYAKWTVGVNAGYAVPHGGQVMISGLYNNGGAIVAAVGFTSVNGVLYWQGFYSTDGTPNTSTLVSPTVLTTGVAHTIEVYSYSGAGNGVFAYWVDGVMQAFQESLTNTTYAASQIVFGENYCNVGYTASVSFDNFYLYTGSDATSNVWQTALATPPNVVFFDGSKLGRYIPVIPGASSADLDWYWAGNLLYVSSTSNPGTRFGRVEAGARNNAILSNGKPYLSFMGLASQGSNDINSGGIAITDWSSSVTVQECDSGFHAGSGIIFTGSHGGGDLIANNTIHDANVGIGAYQYSGAGPGTEVTITRNTISGIGYKPPGVAYPFSEGINWYGNYAIIESNTLTNNGSAGTDANGLSIYNTVGGGYGAHNIVRYNVVSSQIDGSGLDGSGINLDHDTSNNQIYYNVSYGNEGPGIAVGGSHNNLIANNTLYNDSIHGRAGHLPGMAIPTGSTPTSDELEFVGGINNGTDYNTIQNNIAYSTQPGYAVLVDTVTAAMTHNVYSYNLFYGSAQANWYSWAGAPGGTLSTFNALAGGSANLNAPPLFVDPDLAGFTLQPGSPAIGAGVFIPGVSAAPPNIGAR